MSRLDWVWTLGSVAVTTWTMYLVEEKGWTFLKPLKALLLPLESFGEMVVEWMKLTDARFDGGSLMAALGSTAWPLAYGLGAFALGLLILKKRSVGIAAYTTDEAIECFRHARRVSPKLVQAYNNLANALAVQGKSDEAIAEYQEAVRISPDYAEGWNKRATVHFLLDDYGRSLADIARVLELEPRHFGALSGLGLIFRALDDDARAMAAYRQALEIDPFLTDVREALEAIEAETAGSSL